MDIFRWLWGLGLFLQGCAQAPVQMQALESAPVCCRSFADMPISGRIGQESLTVEITANSPNFTFSTGKSFFQAMELSPLADGAEIEVRTFFTGIIAPTAHYLYPAITFLDESFNSLGVSQPQSLQHEHL